MGLFQDRMKPVVVLDDPMLGGHSADKLLSRSHRVDPANEILSAPLRQQVWRALPVPAGLQYNQVDATAPSMRASGTQPTLHKRLGCTREVGTRFAF